MKKLSTGLFMALIACTAFSSCSKPDNLMFQGFETTITEVPLTIPVIENINEPDTAFSVVHFNLDSLVTANTNGRFSTSDVHYVRVKEVKINITNTNEDDNAASFENIGFSLGCADHITPVAVASSGVPDISAASVKIVVMKSPELKDALKSSSLTFNLICKARRKTHKELQATISLALSIN